MEKEKRNKTLKHVLQFVVAVIIILLLLFACHILRETPVEFETPAVEERTTEVVTPPEEPSEPEKEEISICVLSKEVVYGTDKKDISFDFGITEGKATVEDISRDIEIKPQSSYYEKKQYPDVGQYSLEVNYTGDKYIIKDIEYGSLKIYPRPVKLVIDDKGSYVGKKLKALTYTVTSLDTFPIVEGDNLEELFELQTDANRKKAGKYEITLVSNNSNYEFCFEPGVYTVWKEKSQATTEETANNTTTTNTLDKRVLDQQRATAEKVVETNYTVESWNEFKAAYEAAKAMPENTQPEVDAKALAIYNAIGKLVVATKTDNENQNQGSGNNESSGNDSDNGNNNNQDSGNNNGNDNNKPAIKDPPEGTEQSPPTQGSTGGTVQLPGEGTEQKPSGDNQTSGENKNPGLPGEGIDKNPSEGNPTTGNNNNPPPIPSEGNEQKPIGGNPTTGNNNPPPILPGEGGDKTPSGDNQT